MHIHLMVCTHKADPCRDRPPYYPIHVGKALSNVDLGFPGDDTGVHMSDKNKQYCELTALFWAWKNLPKEVEVVGLTHYRRYFNLGENPSKRIEQYLQNADILMTQPWEIPYSIADQYCIAHIKEDLDVLSDVLADMYPAYIDSFDWIMRHVNRLSLYNMFICRREHFDNYCAWLFPLLAALEERLTPSPHAYQQRVIGFIAERLLNVYVYHHRLTVKHIPISFINEGIDPYTESRISVSKTLRQYRKAWRIRIGFLLAYGVTGKYLARLGRRR